MEDHRSLLLPSPPSPAVSETPPIDGVAFASLCFDASSAARSRLLRHAQSLVPEPHLRLTLLLGFTRDPHPRVRTVSLDGLAALAEFGDVTAAELVGGCYLRAAELLSDAEDCVRSSAIRAVCAWGLVLSASNQDMKTRYSDEVYVKLCSMARDMSMKVRVEAFVALGKMEMVSEEVLLQSLSKKVLRIVKEKKSLGRCCGEPFEVLVSSVAGALLHGLEDEFYEVRKSVCSSLSSLILISASFAVEALALLMDMLNDDSLIVRLQALDTMHHMAVCDRLKLLAKHIHMFLGPLCDKKNSIRHSTRKILKIVKLSGLELFKLAVDALIQNLARYPEDEADIFSALFHIGQRHGKFVAHFVDDKFHQIEPTSGGKLEFDDPKVAAMIVLAISAPILGDNACVIQPIIYSYAVTMLGRISSALSDVIDQSSLLTYLSHCCRCTRVSAAAEFKQIEQPIISADNRVDLRDCIIESDSMPLQENFVPDVAESMNAILARIKDAWPLGSGNIHKVLHILRSCREDLSRLNSIESSGVVAFTYQYTRILELISKAFEHFQPPKSLAPESATLEFLFAKLERRLRQIKSLFIGLSREEELHILELKLLAYTLRLSQPEIFCRESSLTSLAITVSQIESLSKEGSVELELSEFVTEIGKSSKDGKSCALHRLKKLTELFSLKQLVISRGLELVKAELEVPENDFVTPLCFVPGLPVGISCRIILRNVVAENKLWLRMRMDDGSVQLIFLDPSRYKDRENGCWEFTILAPFYGTPKALCFSVKLCVGVECEFEDFRIGKGCWGGPKHELAYLCKEKEVFLAMKSSDQTRDQNAYAC